MKWKKNYKIDYKILQKKKSWYVSHKQKVISFFHQTDETINRKKTFTHHLLQSVLQNHIFHVSSFTYYALLIQ